VSKSNHYGQFGVYYDSPASGPGTIKAYSSRDNNADADQLAYSSPTTLTDAFHFVVLKWDGTTMSLKVDNGTAVTVPKTTISPSTFSFRIGTDERNDLYWDGWIDEVGTWSRALSAAEETELYNAGAGKTHPFS
jgi:hypothetical protein